MSEACNEVHARITVSEARTPPHEESRVTSLGGYDRMSQWLVPKH